MKAIFVDANSTGRLVIQDTDAPNPNVSEALVSVHAVSLNRGEVKRSLTSAPAGTRPGWDLAGIVSQAAADGSGPKLGTRVVGLVKSGAWAEQVAVPTHSLAELPDSVTFAQASTLPVAGLTALHALWKGGFLLGRTVLVTGATGGVGDYAIQLGKLAGAKIVAHIRREEQRAQVEEAGADAVIVSDRLTDARAHGPYALILDSVGGQVLGDALSLVSEGTKIVSFGTSAGNSVTFNAEDFYYAGMTTLYGMILFDDLRTVEPASVGLARLAKFVAEGKLTPRIALEKPWTEIASVAKQLFDRSYPGKAVLHIIQESSTQ